VGLMGASYLPAASRFTLSRIGHSLLDPAAQNKEQNKEGPPATPIANKCLNLDLTMSSLKSGNPYAGNGAENTSPSWSSTSTKFT